MIEAIKLSQEKFKDSSHYAVWLYLNTIVKDEANSVWIEDTYLELLPYQVATSTKKIGEATSIERSKTGRILKSLTKQNLIEVETSKRYTLVRLLSYDQSIINSNQDKIKINQEQSNLKQSQNVLSKKREDMLLKKASKKYKVKEKKEIDPEDYPMNDIFF